MNLCPDFYFYIFFRRSAATFVVGEDESGDRRRKRPYFPSRRKIASHIPRFQGFEHPFGRGMSIESTYILLLFFYKYFVKSTFCYFPRLCVVSYVGEYFRTLTRSSRTSVWQRRAQPVTEPTSRHRSWELKATPLLNMSPLVRPGSKSAIFLKY